jgi:uncharacterized membrane protein
MDFTSITTASLAIQIHLAFAVIAIALIIVIICVKRGSKAHKLIGRVWVTAMTLTAISSFWISEIDHFMGFSAIHLLSVFTLYNCYVGVTSIRRGNQRAHRNAMVGTAIGGLLIAGSLSFMPGRMLNEFVALNLF